MLVKYSAKSVRQLTQYRQQHVKWLLAAWHFIILTNINQFLLYSVTVLINILFGDEVLPKGTLNPIDSYELM